MKITTKIVYDVQGRVLLEKSFEYQGIISMCGGGGKSSTPEVTPPPEPVQKVQTKSITESAQTARDNQQEKALKAKGIKSTILTSDDEEQAILTQSTSTVNNTKSLLGQ